MPWTFRAVSPADPDLIRTPLLGALALVVRSGSVLLVQRKKMPDAGLWGFPGGHVEWGETALAAAARELQEETGVIAEPVEYLTNIDVLRHDAEGAAQVHYLLAAVLCDYVDGAPMAADDVSDAGWVSFAEIVAQGRPMSARVEELTLLAVERQRLRAAARA